MSQASTAHRTVTLVIIAFIVTATPVFATDCSKLPGTREATADDVVVKNGQISAGTCWNPNDPGIGKVDEEAKLFLRSLPRSGSASEDANIAKLNNAFAKCAAKFLKDFSQRYGAVTISSAYRSAARIVWIPAGARGYLSVFYHRVIRCCFACAGQIAAVGCEYTCCS